MKPQECFECGCGEAQTFQFTTYDGVTRCHVCEHERACDSPDCAWCAPVVTSPAEYDPPECVCGGTGRGCYCDGTRVTAPGADR